MKYEIILCIHKDHNNLCNCLKSIDKNLTSELGLLIILNGKESNSLKKKIKLTLKSNYFKIITTPQQGFSNALNIGLNASRATYIIRHDSDDIWLNERFNLVKKAVKINPKAAIISFSFFEDFRSRKNSNLKLTKSKNIKLKNLLFKNIINHPTVVFKRNIVINLGGYREFPFAEDYDLWLRALHKNQIIIKYDNPVIIYSKQSISAARNSAEAYLSMGFSLLLLFNKRKSIIFLLSSLYQFLKSFIVFGYNLIFKK